MTNTEIIDCTTCKYGYEDEHLGIPMCHHPKRFSEDCVDFNMHEEKHLEDEPDKSLEEAAENYEQTRNDLDAISDNEIVRRAFIAGAEWMAGQGVTLKVTDDTTWGEVNDFIHRNCDGVKEIQIRKKEESK